MQSNNRIDALTSTVENLVSLVSKNQANSSNTASAVLSPVTAGMYATQGVHYNGVIAGNNPLLFVATYFPWLAADSSLLDRIVTRKMEVKDLIKLVPEEHRPKGKGRAPLGLSSGFYYDADTEKLMTVKDSTATAHEKEFPTIATAIYALQVYCAIRAAYDSQHIGFGPAIAIHIKTLIEWHFVDSIAWEPIRTYFIVHFRKH